MSFDTLKFADEEVAQLKKDNRFLKPRVLQSAQAPVSVIDGKEVVNLTSNNYLAMADNPKVKKAAIAAIEKYGIGSAAVRTIIGTMSLHTELEEKFAAFKHSEASILFQSGFTSNVAVCQSLMSSEQDLLISDELNHASIIDGARLAKSPRKIYRHKDIKHLTEILESPEARAARRKMVVTDGVFSMDGDVANLDEVVATAHKYGAFVMVDDAHASGVIGKQGRGTVSHFNLDGQVEIQIGTLSKAFAAVGGYAATTASLRDYLGSVARPFLFSSSQPPSVAASCLAVLDILLTEPDHLKRLWDNTNFFKEEMKKAGFNTGESVTPITPVMIGDMDKARALSAKLFEEGVFALPLGFPTVPKGRERLRTIVTAGHTLKNLEFAVEKFKKAGKELGII
ncbi:MAG: glycine C-acetyltransferase [Elusimicrobia bacterium GWA2_64_40]|nr:MAG: glycine C-acetyltransferase [Elusimicrobia bacterium GWA2_64_40]OGR63352.1 MAG: glycine C-acetyltransferase [Elusimicrobia bacterium GWB2_63_16]HAN04103.1 glycine C-acetyltransferase [Elusimicrobiota bacterium]